MTRMKSILSIATAITALVFHILPAQADAGKCEPDKLATKYPGLVGKTIRIGQDGESPPYSYRDPSNFDNLIGLDADMAERRLPASACRSSSRLAHGPVCCQQS